MAQNEHLSVTLFAFDKDEEISTHESGGDAFVTCLDGVGKITIDGEEYILHEGESIVMPAKHPHAVYGQEQFKMLLVERAITAEQAAPDAPQAEEDLLTAAVNRTILEGFSALYEQIAEEYGVTPVTDPDFELLAVNRAEGFRAGAKYRKKPA